MDSWTTNDLHIIIRKVHIHRTAAAAAEQQTAVVVVYRHTEPTTTCSPLTLSAAPLHSHIIIKLTAVVQCLPHHDRRQRDTVVRDPSHDGR